MRKRNLFWWFGCVGIVGVYLAKWPADAEKGSTKRRKLSRAVDVPSARAAPAATTRALLANVARPVARIEPEVVAPAEEPAPRRGLDRSPGPHFGDKIAKEELDRWNGERFDPRSAPARQRKVTDLFEGSEAAALKEVECRASLCRITFNAAELAQAVPAAAKLGFSVAVLENNATRVVILVPGLQIDALPET